MKRCTPDELAEALHQHKLWLNDEGGTRADLSGAYLPRAYLSRADLSGAYLSRADLSGADLSEADLSGAYLSGAYLSRADLSGADLSEADLSGAYLSGANLFGAYLSGVKISSLRAFSGLYKYQCQAAVSTEGVPWIRMGCLWKSLSDWDAIGIRNSNPREFPDDGSEKSERRARAFDYVRQEVLVMVSHLGRS